VAEQERKIIYWRTRSRVTLTSVLESLERGFRPAVAVAWSFSDQGPWQMMKYCPVPDDSTRSAWAILSGRFAHVPFEQVPW
jgi:hypothetical protein